MFKGIDVTFPNMKNFFGRDSECISCDIKYKGKKIAHYNNDGNGGMGIWHTYDPKFRPLLEELEEKISELIWFDDHRHDMDSFISAWLDNRDLIKQSKKGVVFENAGGEPRFTSWKGWNMKKLMEHPKGKETVQGAIDKIKQEGGTILVPEYYEGLGLKV